MRLIDRFRTSLGFDYRSMALYRALIGIMVMCDVIYRLPDLMNFYTDLGLIPRSLFLSELSMPWSFSLHLSNGSLPFISVLFGLHFILGAMIFFGFKTRWAFFGAYLLTVSLHNRNWTINNGGDDVLRSLLLLSIFLPTNRWWSVDSAMSSEEKPKNTWISFWVVAFTFQAFAIYFLSYILKDHPIWRSDFNAVYFASRLDAFSTPLGIFLRSVPYFDKLTTIFTIYLEFLGPILLVVPFLFGRFWWVARMLTVVLFCGLHFGILSTMYIGLFPYICISMWTIFIPGPVWDRIFNSFRKKGCSQLKVYFDQECGFCKKSVYLLREFFLFPEVAIAPAQSDEDASKLMSQSNSWVIQNEKGESFGKFAAFLELVKHSPLIFWALPFFSIKLIQRIGNFIYTWISCHRSFMGKFTQCLEWSVPKKSFRTFIGIREIFGLFVLLTLLSWNASTVKSWKHKSKFFQSSARWLHVYQEWNMFAPFPKMDNVWIDAVAELSDGTVMELHSGDKDIYRVKDQDFVKNIKNEHWRKFYLNASSRTDYLRFYGGYLCRLWNTRKERPVNSKLRKVELISYSQVNLLGDKKGEVETKLRWKHWCFDEDYKREMNL